MIAMRVDARTRQSQQSITKGLVRVHVSLSPSAFCAVASNEAFAVLLIPISDSFFCGVSRQRVLVRELSISSTSS